MKPEEQPVPEQTNTTPEMPAEMAGMPVPKDKLLGRLGKIERFKDKQYGENIDEMYSDLDSFIEEQEGSVNAANEFKANLAELFKTYPDVMEFIQVLIDAPEEMSKDQAFALALNTVFTKEELQSILDSEGDNIQAIRDKRKMAAELQNEIETNLDKFPDVVEEFSSVIKIPEDKKEGFLEYLQTTIPNMIAARFTVDLLKRLYQGYIFEEKMAENEEDKTVAKSNAKEEKPKTSSIPIIESSSKPIIQKEEKPMRPRTPLDDVMEYNKRKA